ncbi:Hypothetical protein SRAE_X000026900 [Strongyloides ratti]|uniref:Uncharacterized protein n=1 Tax=Strongyloides ratti TaxID=34506 RepID=A0A090LTI3_STRRB|nr:Hypothetical protein SRAE_X000026900 [Strongyloides ratti]CEF70939.1 Hypothetical protein SRAE_X000026900 [Strongyloides ratti]
MSLLKVLFFSIFFGFIIFTTNGCNFKCTGWLRGPCQLIIDVKTDVFLPKAKSLMFIQDYNSLQLAWYQRHKKQNALPYMNKIVALKFDQNMVKRLCTFYNLRYRNPTSIMLIDSSMRTNSFRSNSFRSNSFRSNSIKNNFARSSLRNSRRNSFSNF